MSCFSKGSSSTKKAEDSFDGYVTAFQRLDYDAGNVGIEKGCQLLPTNMNSYGQTNVWPHF